MLHFEYLKIDPFIFIQVSLPATLLLPLNTANAALPSFFFIFCVLLQLTYHAISTNNQMVRIIHLIEFQQKNQVTKIISTPYVPPGEIFFVVTPAKIVPNLTS